MNSYLISICIPTYNRINDLRKTLKNILDNFGESEEIEIVVCDNGSTDGTKSFLEELKIQYNNLTIFIRNYNAGFDQNLLDCFLLAQGDYIHFLGDDDSLIIENFDNLIHFIKIKKPDLLISDYEIHTKHTKYLAINKKSVNFSTIEEVFSYTGHGITFMSCITLKKPAPLKEGLFNKYNDLQFMHIALLLELFSGNKGKIVFSSIPIVIATDKNMPNYSVIDLFGNKLAKIIQYNQEKIDKRKLVLFTNSVFCFILSSKVKVKELINNHLVIYSLFTWHSILYINLWIRVGAKLIKEIISKE